MKALITGANGFVGHHLTEHLVAGSDFELFGTVRDTTQPTHQAITLMQVDLRDPDAVTSVLKGVKPDVIFHLAAQSFVPLSFQYPWDTLENNIKGQVNLFEAMLTLELDARILVVSSAEVYGRILPNENPVGEDQPFRPANPYSVSKVAQDMLALQYHAAYGMQTFRARAFNHIGPGQNTRFAMPNFARQIALAEVGAAPAIVKTGNLSAERDFTDVRDVVRAYYEIVMQGQPGEVYNVCRGEAFRMRALLDKMCQMSTVDLNVRLDTERLRPLDVPRVIGDASKLHQHTAWQPQIGIDQSLSDILEYARHQMVKS